MESVFAKCVLTVSVESLSFVLTFIITGQYNARVTVIDNPVNAIIIGRMFAFVGEICWGQQISWAMRTIARNIPMRGPLIWQQRVRAVCIFISYWLVTFAIVGNIMSVTGTITKNYVFPTVEETLWACLFFFGAVCALLIWFFGCDTWSFDYGRNCFGWDINPFEP